LVTTATPYRKENIKPFFEELLDDDLQEGYFQQDGPTAHCTRDTVDAQDIFFFIISSSVETQKVLNLQQV
jgi:hypothetical protein